MLALSEKGIIRFVKSIPTTFYKHFILSNPHQAYSFWIQIKLKN